MIKVEHSYCYKIPKAFVPLRQSLCQEVIECGGRVSGKSANTYQDLLITMLEHPYHDAIIMRDSYDSLRDSSFQELKSLIDNDDCLTSEFKCQLSPLRIKRRGNSGTIYFVGIGGADKDRTKGLKTEHPLCYILGEELQQLDSQESLEQAMASYRRRLDPKCWKIVYLYNPPSQKFHWCNVWGLQKSQDKKVLTLNTSYEDIIDFINDIDLREILKDKRLNKPHYNWFYLGLPGAGIGSVFPMFQPEYHLIKRNELITRLGNLKIVGMVIGGDAAVNNDMTALVPIAILSSGQTLTLEKFIHDPKRSGVIGSHPLVEKYATKWFYELDKKYGLTANQVPIKFAIDSAATDFIQSCKFFFSNRALVSAYKKQHITEMVDTVQSCITKNMCFVLDEGGYFDYVRNEFVPSADILAKELTDLVWNEKETGYNPIIPNDVSDAYTYGINEWFRNPENVYWLDALKSSRKEYYSIRKGEE